MDVELRQITSETVRAICELEAHFTRGHWMRAIYADVEPVGFVLTFDDPSSCIVNQQLDVALARADVPIKSSCFCRMTHHALVT